jgi:hypothetical protein
VNGPGAPEKSVKESQLEFGFTLITSPQKPNVVYMFKKKKTIAFVMFLSSGELKLSLS